MHNPNDKYPTRLKFEPSTKQILCITYTTDVETGIDNKSCRPGKIYQYSRQNLPH